MKSRDLETEMWQAVQSVRQIHIDRLVGMGVSGAALAGLGAVQPPFGVSRVTWLSNGLYEPDCDGEHAVIVPVFEPNNIGLPALVDLIAWCTADPSRWYWRIGTAWALGDNLLDDDLPVHVVATPLDWLKSGGEAFCVLDWASPSQCWACLRSGPSLQFDDDALRRRLRNALNANLALPPMETIYAA